MKIDIFFKRLSFYRKRVPKTASAFSLSLAFLLLISCHRPYLEQPVIKDTDESNEFNNVHFIKADLKLPLTAVTETNLRGTAVGAFIPLGKQFALVTANGYFYTMEKKGFENAANSRPARGISTAPAYADGRLYIASEWNKTGLNVYDFSQQKIVWELENAFSVSTPVIWQNKIFHAQKNGIIRCLNAKTFRKIWQNDVQDQIRSSLAFDGEYLFAASLSGIIQALVPESGSLAWQTELNETVRAAPATSASFVIVATVSGKLFLFDKRTGKIKFTKNFQQPFFTAPAVYENYLYICSSGGKISAFDLQSKTLLWTKELEGAAMVPPLILSTKIIVGTSRRQLYILDKNDGSVLQQMELEGRLSALPLPYDQGLIVGYEYKKLTFLKYTDEK